MAFFDENTKGLALLFDPKMKASEMAFFDENTKGLTLLFEPKMKPSENFNF